MTFIVNGEELTLTEMIEKGLILSAPQVAKKHGISDRHVVRTCREGKFGTDAVWFGSVWLITVDAAERVWGSRETLA